jgi:hypothetical protein
MCSIEKTIRSAGATALSPLYRRSTGNCQRSHGLSAAAEFAGARSPAVTNEPNKRPADSLIFMLMGAALRRNPCTIDRRSKGANPTAACVAHLPHAATRSRRPAIAAVPPSFRHSVMTSCDINPPGRFPAFFAILGKAVGRSVCVPRKAYV